MKYKIIPADTAEDDLDNIGDYITQDSPKTASEFVTKLVNHAKSLEKFPMRGKKYNAKYRMLIVERGYRIFYKVNQDTKEVTIVHFFSPYQNIPSDM